MRFSESLKKNSDFQTVYKKGNSNANKYLVMYIMKNGIGKNRLGISVSKKVGNSIVRHRLTRLIRESYRLQEEKFPCGLDIVIIARSSAKGKSYKEIGNILNMKEGTVKSRIHNVRKKIKNLLPEYF